VPVQGEAAQQQDLNSAAAALQSQAAAGTGQEEPQRNREPAADDDMLAKHAELRTKSSSSLDKLIAETSPPSTVADGSNGDITAKPPMGERTSCMLSSTCSTQAIMPRRWPGTVARQGRPIFLHARTRWPSNAAPALDNATSMAPNR
jgi:hypothetical protein